VAALLLPVPAAAAVPKLVAAVFVVAAVSEAGASAARPIVRGLVHPFLWMAPRREVAPTPRLAPCAPRSRRRSSAAALLLLLPPLLSSSVAALLPPPPCCGHGCCDPRR